MNGAVTGVVPVLCDVLVPARVPPLPDGEILIPEIVHGKVETGRPIDRRRNQPNGVDADQAEADLERGKRPQSYLPSRLEPFPGARRLLGPPASGLDLK
jgi:hypothetical protein